MAGIQLEFAQFGHFTSFDVIRSMASMASVANADLPTPIATGLKTMYYVDSDVVEGLIYYYKVRVWRGATGFVSDEIAAFAGPSYRWLLIRITANNGNTYTSMQEIEIASEVDGPDITRPYPENGYSQSSFYAPLGNNASKLIDNNLIDYTNSAWVSGGYALEHWVAIDLKEQRSMSQVKIYAQNYADGLFRAPKDFKIQGSNDGVTFDDIATFTDVTGWTLGVPKVFNLLTKTYI